LIFLKAKWPLQVFYLLLHVLPAKGVVVCFFPFFVETLLGCEWWLEVASSRCRSGGQKWALGGVWGTSGGGVEGFLGGDI